MQVEGVSKTKDLIFKTFESESINSFVKLPIIVFYKSPKDYPEKYVARLFDTNKPTKMILVKNNLEDLRKSIPGHMTRINTSPCDDEVIIESYI